MRVNVNAGNSKLLRHHLAVYGVHFEINFTHRTSGMWKKLPQIGKPQRSVFKNVSHKKVIPAFHVKLI